jgi:acetyl esterase/lipase
MRSSRKPHLVAYAEKLVPKATVIARIARDEGVNGIIGQILNIPVTCHPDHYPSGHKNSSYKENMDAPIVDAERMRWFWRNYLPGGGADPLASPLLDKSLAGLPPARAATLMLISTRLPG